jgi:hypothetical protein
MRKQLRLPSMQEAIRRYEEKKQEHEAVVTEHRALVAATKIHCTTEQRARKHYLEFLSRTLRNELFSAECTLVEVQWYGEEAVI